MHLPRILLLGDWGGESQRAAVAGQVVVGLVGAADVVVRPTPPGYTAAHLLQAAALPALIPADGPPFHAVWLAVDADPETDEWARLAAAVKAAAGGEGVRLGGPDLATAPAFLAWLGLGGPAARPLLPPVAALEASPHPDRALREWVNGARPRDSAGWPAASFAPAAGPRGAPLHPPSAALLLVDAQNFNCNPAGALYSPSNGAPACTEEERAHFFRGLDGPGGVADRWAGLLAAARAARLFVLHTVIEAQDGRLRDTGLDYRLSGFFVPPGSWDAQPVLAAAPARGEPRLPKTTSSPFGSTPIAAMLRSAGVTQLAVAGCITDQCIAATVMDAADAGFLVTLVHDACLTYSRERHESALRALRGYGRQVATAELVRELGGEGEGEGPCPPAGGGARPPPTQVEEGARRDGGG